MKFHFLIIVLNKVLQKIVILLYDDNRKKQLEMRFLKNDNIQKNTGPKFCR